VLSGNGTGKDTRPNALSPRRSRSGALRSEAQAKARRGTITRIRSSLSTAPGSTKTGAPLGFKQTLLRHANLSTTMKV